MQKEVYAGTYFLKKHFAYMVYMVIEPFWTNWTEYTLFKSSFSSLLRSFGRKSHKKEHRSPTNHSIKIIPTNENNKKEWESYVSTWLSVLFHQQSAENVSENISNPPTSFFGSLTVFPCVSHRCRHKTPPQILPNFGLVRHQEGHVRWRFASQSGDKKGMTTDDTHVTDLLRIPTHGFPMLP